MASFLQRNFFPSVCAFVIAVFATTLPAMAALHEGDTLLVTVFNHPELSREVKIDAAGNVSLPLAGSVSARGAEVGQVAERVRRALVPYVIMPAVQVTLSSQASSIFISGNGGGVLVYQPEETLAAALADAQKLQSSGDLRLASQAALQRMNIDFHRVMVRRDGNVLGTYDTVQLEQVGDPGPKLEPGDTIVFVDKVHPIQVQGAVVQPGVTYLSDSQTLAEAITQAGGLDPSAATSHIVVEHDGRADVVALADPLMNSAPESGEQITVPTAPRVSVAGSVGTPGQVTLKTDNTLLTALYDAGGPTKWANLRSVSIVHSGVTKSYDITKLTHGDLTQNPVLADGDVVLVPEGHKIDFSPIIQALSLPIAAVQKL